MDLKPGRGIDGSRQTQAGEPFRPANALPRKRRRLIPRRIAARGRATFHSATKLELPMAVTRTFSIIKPDATRRNLTGAVTKMLEEAGLRVVASKRIHMTREQAEGFYAVHKERPFFGELVSFMISGPVVVQVLEGENAMQRNRDIMGATNPANAEPGTIRKELAESIEANTVHGSDSDENAAIEIAYFFKPEEIVG
jgi:nucleoside-diphosphate kinase